MPTQYRCGNENRRDAVRNATNSSGDPVLNGMDCLEVVSPDEKSLEVHFIHPLPGQTGAVPPSPAPALTENNFVILGGVRVQGIKVAVSNTAENVITMVADAAGDYSTYTLKLVSGEESDQPPSGFDPQLSELRFTFKIECPSDFDCAPHDECPPETLVTPLIDYLAKDYGSFRRLMLDRLAVTMSDWAERNPADLGVALVESVAYLADQLSYYQDAVATEAYLGTARERVSMRRHARLLDYTMHEGCNARAWVSLEVTPGGGADGLLLPKGTVFLTKGRDEKIVVVAPTDLDDLLRDEHPLVFESLHDLTPNGAHNSIRFYTWDDTECCLPEGATRATLYNDPALSLAVGDILVLEEVLGPDTGEPADADPAHRHVVRLTKVATEDTNGDPLTDLLYGTAVAEVEWDAADALPFPLCVSTMVSDDTGKHLVEDLSLARGNTVLVDQGQTLSGEELGSIGTDAAGNLARPMLQYGPVARQGHARDRFGELVRDAQSEPVVFDPDAPATSAMSWEMRDTLPAVTVIENGNTSRPWLPRFDLLGSNRFDPHFCLETDKDARAFIRFGDGFHGEKPRPASTFTVDYRVGNGAGGNVGAEAITRLVVATEGIDRVRNLLPAKGGADPESLEEVRQYAPEAFRTQERAVTELDYAEMAERHPEVQKAAATLRWTGSWYTMFITIDRAGGRAVDAAFEQEMLAFMERFRLAGQDIEIDGPRFVPLDIVFTVCLLAGYSRAQVKEDLLRRFSSRVLPDGTLGFFHPDNFSFGQTVYLSQLIALVMSVPGVKWVDGEDTALKPNRFRRWGQNAAGEFEAGMVKFGRLEIARLDNDPSAPENGRIDFILEGGM
jgi:baseplate J-like protein